MHVSCVLKSVVEDSKNLAEYFLNLFAADPDRASLETAYTLSAVPEGDISCMKPRRERR